MAAFGTGAGRPLYGRGGSPGFKFTIYAVLSVVAMYLDQRQHYLERVRYVLQGAAYPVQLLVSSPPAAWRWVKTSFQDRQSLQAENARLSAQQRDLELRSMRYEALARENGELRGLHEALPSVAERWLPAEIVSIQLTGLRQNMVLNRGAANGVFKGQAVLDAKGLIGQTIHVGPWSAEVILITDPEHAVPVRVGRTGLRTIAVGAGDSASLALPYLPANADIKVGDTLVTSGLGGVFPEGYPVAHVIEVHRDAVQPLAQVRAEPLAHVESDSEVMLIWFRANHPAAPGGAATATNEPGADLKSGDPSIQPQAVVHAAAAPAPVGAATAPAAKAPVGAATAPAGKAPVGASAVPAVKAPVATAPAPAGHKP